MSVWRVFIGALMAGLWLAMPVGPAAAHEVRPGYIEINETARERFEIAWKQPVRDARNSVAGLGLRPVFPVNCQRLGASQMTRRPGVLVENFQLACLGGLLGQPIGVDGLQKTITDVFVRLTTLDGRRHTLRLTPDYPVQDLQGGGVGLHAYFGLGVEHLLFGYDHILFVIGLVLLVGEWRRLVYVITAFTVAHSLTLGLAMLAGVSLPSAPVEAVIALSILFVAVELSVPPERRSPLARDYPQVVAFGFGLLHGFGFAGVLGDIGLPQDTAAWALGLFNVGLEAGQLLLVAAMLAAQRFVWPRLSPAITSQKWLAEAPIVVIGGLSVYWLVDRTSQILGV